MSGVLNAINVALDVPDRSRSSLEELSRYFDPATAEYVITLQYRVMVPPKPVSVDLSPMSPLLDAILDCPTRKHAIRRGGYEGAEKKPD